MVRFFLLVLFVVLAVAAVVAASFGTIGWIVLGVLVLLLVVLGLHDLFQTKHAILRNYPVLGRMRYLLEAIRPEIQQYFIERNTDGRPFDRVTRSLVYSRAKGVDSHKAFGTERDVNAQGYEFLLHSNSPIAPPERPHRVRIGGPDCRHPYDLSLMNISSMSFGALSSNAVLAMNKGAALGGFAQETGEGGLSKFHLEYGADILWEIGSGYFGCRDENGGFAPETFRTKSAYEQVKGITLKLSQGAKPGIGGVLPKEKITPEIAEARGVPMGEDCISPASHSTFHTPRELMEFVGTLRELADGKPIGYKFCVGSRTDVLAMCKAMLETGITPDYIIIDGSEGGTGAAPLEYEDHVGTPLTEGLMLMHNALVGVGLRDRIRLGAAGKVATGSDIVKRLIQGADFTMSARSMMMATGCIQAQICHTNRCPVGVTTQNPRLARAVDVDDKGNRVHNYHKLTVAEAGQIMASMGVFHPEQLNQRMLHRRVDHLTTSSYAVIYDWLRPSELLENAPRSWAEDWNEADADRFGTFAPIPWLEPLEDQNPRERGIDEDRSGGPSRKDVNDWDTGTTARVESSGNRPEGRLGD
jgi:glutamate synthase domain-containing protein 2